MYFFAAFFGELLMLFFISQTLTKTLSYSLYRIIRNKKVTISVLAFLFFPGTLIHELAHYLTAIFLFVKVGEMHLFPQLQGEHVRLGSVQISKSDPLRRFFIGVSPIVIGALLVFFILNILVHNTVTLYIVKINQISLALKCVLVYVLFVISNTMFSSRKDVEGALELLAAVFFVIILALLFGLRIPVDKLFTEQTVSFLKTCDVLLLIPLSINAGIIAVFKIFSK